MNHNNYKFIDTAFGGAHKRNKVIDMIKLKTPQRIADCFTTYFRFKKEYKIHVNKTGSVRGSKVFSCWSDFLWFDIDSENLDIALSQTKRLLIALREYDIEKHIVLFFSGSKGFHVGINATLFGFEPSPQLPGEMRSTAETIANLYDVEIDTVVYDHNRLWRIPGSVHGKTKLKKTLLDSKKLLKYDLY